MTSFITRINLKLNIKNKLKINPFFWMVIIAAILTGQFIEIITLFGVVIIHELGHVFAARSYGWEITEVQLLPFGGVAKVDAKGDSIQEELIVALSGPFQNFLMILVGIGFQKANMWSSEWTAFFIHANILIGAFNLLPISPLDGHRILKSILHIFIPFKRAGMIAIFISILLSIFFIIWSIGFMYTLNINLNGVILGIFFLTNIYGDLKHIPYSFWQFLIRKRQSRDLQKRNATATQIVVHKDTKLIHALSSLYKGRYHLFYLIDDDGDIIKIIPEEKLLKKVILEKHLYTPISKVSTKN